MQKGHKQRGGNAMYDWVIHGRHSFEAGRI